MTTLSFNGSPQDLKVIKEKNEFKNLLREGLNELKAFRKEENTEHKKIYP